MAGRALRCGGYTFDLRRPLVMGVVNVTPDSFSDGGHFLERDRAVAQARQLAVDGADLIDIGGESTRPGAASVSVDQELERVVPVVATLAESGIAVSVDTRKPAVMRAALAAGAVMINDVAALTEAGALAAVAASDAAVCLMHMRGDPATMQDEPMYADVVGEVRNFLAARVRSCVAAGIASDRIVVDPGFGFGKTLAHNLALLRALPELVADGPPVLVGLSRKSMLGQLTGRPAGERLSAGLAAVLAAVMRGAAIVRVHDVRETVDALKVWRAIGEPAGEPLGGARS